MSLSLGIVGLPNVGKSTLFQALTKKRVPAENFPFCTIDPNVGVVFVPDERLSLLATMSHSAKIVPTAIEFVDIAGLVSGAHEGAGLGNTFLSHIREVDAICQVVRVFQDHQIIHVNGRVDPKDDISTIHTELILADLESASKRLESLRKAFKAGADKETQKKFAVYERVVRHLESEQLLISLVLEKEETILLRETPFLTQKPMLYVLNVSEQEVNNPITLEGVSKEQALSLCVRLEAELAELPEAESREYLASLGLKHSGLERLILAGYQLLDLITFFTTGEKETRAWTVRRGALAPEAAGKIHSDFEKGFIVAETLSWKELLDAGSWSAAREKGKIRTEGKEYMVQDGDVMIFRFQK